MQKEHSKIAIKQLKLIADVHSLIRVGEVKIYKPKRKKKIDELISI